MNIPERRTDGGIWSRPPYLIEWHHKKPVPRSTVANARARLMINTDAPPWIDTGPAGEPFDFTRAMTELITDICRHSHELNHIRPQQLLVSFMQARTGRSSGLQARVTPLRFAGGNLVRHARGRLFQVQRLLVNGEDVLYIITFCLPRFVNQSFDEKMVTVFHELHHIGPNFDGDLRRHRGRYCYHTSSKSDYDERMAQHARSYLTHGANPRLHGFLRLNFAQLIERHGRVIGVRVPRPKILPIPLGEPCLGS